MCGGGAAALGAAIGTAKSGVAIAGLGTFKPEVVMKALIPVVMAGIIAIYGLVVSVLISGSIGDPGAPYSLFSYVASPVSARQGCRMAPPAERDWAPLPVGVTAAGASSTWRPA